MSNKLFCLDAVPQFLNTFDFSVAPPLLFYAYIPIIAILAFMIVFIVRSSGYSLKSKLLFSLGISFILWVINILVQWTVVEASIVYFAWEMTALIEIFIPLSTLYLVYVFINDRDVKFRMKLFFSAIILAVASAVPTYLNMRGFDIVNCEGVVGPLLFIIYFFEVLTAFWIIGIYFNKREILIKNRVENQSKLKQLSIITGSSALFLLIFAMANLAGEITGVYSINLFGPLGMLIFLGFLTYMIVKFQAFNVKLFSAQALVWAVVFFIGAQFFFIRNPINYVLNGITFVMTIIFGNYLISSVKREIEQKEYLSTLNLELKGLIKQRENLVHLITHKVKGSFTRSKYIFAEMVEGSFGKLDDMIMKMAKKGLDSDNEGIHTVDMVLNSFNLGSGIVKYDMKPMDLKKTVEEVLSEKGSRAKDKGLGVEFLAPDAEYKINGDVFWIKEVVNNFVENSIRYSLKGSIHIKLEKLDGKVRLGVKDEGVGLSDDDKKGLFTEGGRGKDSLKMNVDSTGYGLFSVKVIVQAHGGRVWAESEGRDMGSTFWIELPALS